jgi:hypothetical protein
MRNVDELLTLAAWSRHNPSNHLTPLASQAAGHRKTVLHDGSDHLDGSPWQPMNVDSPVHGSHRLMLQQIFRGQGVYG